MLTAVRVEAVLAVVGAFQQDALFVVRHLHSASFISARNSRKGVYILLDSPVIRASDDRQTHAGTAAQDEGVEGADAGFESVNSCWFGDGGCSRAEAKEEDFDLVRHCEIIFQHRCRHLQAM